ncbi:hypothetical protein [Novosphingobium sp.]|uniref:hypothetical protein n=1 Tax=Novosphingobium sp. TaxID=1874826 RepID=UPI001EC80F38|nr:hypothetical protein [Novosphingobium sp.]MBK9009402.1 hypothetical protein [Novosphingobium sp.]
MSGPPVAQIDADRRGAHPSPHERFVWAPPRFGATASSGSTNPIRRTRCSRSDDLAYPLAL